MIKLWQVLVVCFGFAVVGAIDGEELDRQENNATASYCFNVYSGLASDVRGTYSKLCDGDRIRKPGAPSP